MTYQTSYLNTKTRLYHDGDRLVAVATNPTWGKDPEKQMDSQTRYFCLPGIFDPDNQTMIVSPDKLSEIAAGK